MTEPAAIPAASDPAGWRRLHAQLTDLGGGLQLWVALPAALQQGEPHFQHVAAAQIPLVQAGSAQVQVAVGTAFGATSPVRTAAPTLCLSVRLAAGQPWQLPRLAAERWAAAGFEPAPGETERIPLPVRR
jgi:redox-sensitive bicupin YhaK (pirin superfamily)